MAPFYRLFLVLLRSLSARIETDREIKTTNAANNNNNNNA
jgi:hypothetical protein